MNATPTDREVAQSHVIDDVETRRTLAVRTLVEVRELLAVLPHALDNGSHDVVAEYLDRSLVAIETALRGQR